MNGETPESTYVPCSVSKILDLTLEAAQQAALQHILEEAGVESLANDLNREAYAACKAGNIDELFKAKGGCFAKVCWLDDQFWYGLHPLPDIEGRGQGGQTLLDLAISNKWSDAVQQTLRQFGARRSDEPYKFKVAQLESRVTDEGFALSFLDLSGNEFCSFTVSETTYARELVEMVATATSTPFSAGQIIMPSGNLLQEYDLAQPLSSLFGQAREPAL